MLERNSLASVGRRAAGAVADLAVVAVVFVLYAVVVGMIWPNDNIEPYTTSEQVGGLLVIFGLVLTPIVYATLFVRYSGCTLGQLFTGTRTVSLRTADRLTMSASLQRAVAWTVGGWCVGAGLWSASRNDWNQAWHDRLAETVVVRADEYASVLETVRTMLARQAIADLPESGAPPDEAQTPAPAVDVTLIEPTGPSRAPDDVAGPLLAAHHWLMAAACLRASGDESESVIGWQAMALTLSGTPQALRWCNQLAVRYPENSGVHAARSLYLLRDGATDDAERTLAQAQSLHVNELVRLAAAVLTSATGTDHRGEHRQAYLDDGGDPYLLAFLTASVALAAESVRGRAPALAAVRLAPNDAQANALAVHVAVATPGVDLAREQLYAWAEQAVALAPNTGMTAVAVEAAIGAQRPGDAPPPASLCAWADTYRQLRARQQLSAPRSPLLAAAPVPVDVPTGSVLDQPGRCACGHLMDLRGDTAVDYVQQHLVIVGRVAGLNSVEAECPDTGVRWVGLEASEPESLGDVRVAKVPGLSRGELTAQSAAMGGYL